MINLKDQGMCKLCWGVSAFLLVALLVSGYIFGVQGNVTPAQGTDTRKAIVLTAPERDMILAEMRGWLETIQDITVGYAEKNMDDVYETAHKAGMAAATGIPPQLLTKLPGDFKLMGMGTHKAFDGIATEAKSMGDDQVISDKLGTLMTNCVTCHKIYRFKVKGQQ